MSVRSRRVSPDAQVGGGEAGRQQEQAPAFPASQGLTVAGEERLAKIGAMGQDRVARPHRFLNGQAMA